jgi:alpha-L-fucosidase
MNKPENPQATTPAGEDSVHELVGLFRECAQKNCNLSLAPNQLQELADWIEEAAEELCGMVAQSCTMDDKTLNSCCISSHASSMRMLAKMGKIKITFDQGRMVKAVWPDMPNAGHHLQPESEAKGC